MWYVGYVLDRVAVKGGELAVVTVGSAARWEWRAVGCVGGERWRDKRVWVKVWIGI